MDRAPILQAGGFEFKSRLVHIANCSKNSWQLGKTAIVQWRMGSANRLNAPGQSTVVQVRILSVLLNDYRQWYRWNKKQYRCYTNVILAYKWYYSKQSGLNNNYKQL